MIRFAFVLLVLSLCATSSAHAQSYDVTEVKISIQSDDAVKARDEAIMMAQRQAFAQLIGRDVETIKDIKDDEIARLVSNFSIRNERMAVKSYSATYTIRFDPNRTQNFVQTHQFDLVAQPTDGNDLVNTPPESVMPKNIVVLPVLDIGARQVVWDEPNPWRDVWQQKDHSVKGMSVRVPVGDITDIKDVPDATFLQGKEADIRNMMGRYDAHDMYVAVVKNQGAALDSSKGMILSLYRHDGVRLKFVRKMMLNPRPGYAFEDAVLATVQMIVMSENNKLDDESEEIEPSLADDLDAQPTFTETTTTTMTVTNASPGDLPEFVPVTGAARESLTVTVPYQSLQQWVSIQQRLRRVSGVSDVIPVRVSPSSAQIDITTSQTVAQLIENLRGSSFHLQVMPNGENALIEQ